jgi:hypothetical protein
MFYHIDMLECNFFLFLMDINYIKLIQTKEYANKNLQS